MKGNYKKLFSDSSNFFVYVIQVINSFRNDCHSFIECGFEYIAKYCVTVYGVYITLVLIALLCCISSAGLIFYTLERDPFVSFAPTDNKELWQQMQFTKDFTDREQNCQPILEFIKDGSMLNESNIDSILDIEKEIFAIGEPNCEIQKALLNSMTLSQVPMFACKAGHKDSCNTNVTYEYVATIQLKMKTALRYVPKSLRHQLSLPNIWKSTYVLRSYPGMSDNCLNELSDKFSSIISSRQEFKEKNLVYFTNKGIQDEFIRTIDEDLPYLLIGYGVSFVFLALTLGDLSLIHNRIILSVVGILNIGIAFLAGVGLPALFGLSAGHMNNMFIVLLCGIGVDDMFVMCSEYDDVIRKDVKSKKKASIEQILRMTLRRAGFAIMITTITDVLALGTGCFAFVFAMRSLCISTTVAVIVLFIITCTLFMQAMFVDNLRAKQNRDALFCCIKYKKGDTEKREWLFSFYEKCVALLCRSEALRGALIVSTFFAFGLCIYGTIHVDSHINAAEYYFKPDSYIRKYVEKSEDNFYYSPLTAYFMYVPEVDICQISTFDELVTLSKNISQSDGVIGNVTELWLENFYEWKMKTPLKFDSNLEYFTCFFQVNTTEEKCGQGIPHKQDIASRWLLEPDCVTDVRIKFAVNQSDDVTRFMPWIERLRATGVHFNKTHPAFPLTAFGAIIGLVEFTSRIRIQSFYDMSLAFGLCIGVSVIMIPSFQVSFLSAICVLLTTTDLYGMLYFSNMKLEVASAVIILISIGFSVDYSTHVAHSFVNTEGASGQERVYKSLCEIGPAVLRGGISTYIPFIPIGIFSNTYVYRVFFKLFGFIVFFGLFHALVFLPSILCFINCQKKGETYRVKSSERMSSQDVDNQCTVTNLPIANSSVI